MKAMEDAKPTYPAGEVLAYHPINFGWVIAELVRRIDGGRLMSSLLKSLLVLWEWATPTSAYPGTWNTESQRSI